MPGIVVCFSSLPSGVPALDGAGAPLSFGASALAGGGLILRQGSSFSRLYLSLLGGIVYLPSVGNILFIVSHLKTSFVVK